MNPEDSTHLLNRKQFTDKHYNLIETYIHNTERHPSVSIPMRYLPEMAIAYNEATILVGTPAMLLDFPSLLKRARHILVDKSSIFSHVDSHTIVSQTQIESFVAIGDVTQLYPHRHPDLRRFPKYNTCSLAFHLLSHAQPLTMNMFKVYRSHPAIVEALSFAAYDN